MSAGGKRHKELMEMRRPLNFFEDGILATERAPSEATSLWEDNAD
jgi:hypothetical protein